MPPLVSCPDCTGRRSPYLTVVGFWPGEPRVWQMACDNAHLWDVWVE